MISEYLVVESVVHKVFFCKIIDLLVIVKTFVWVRIPQTLNLLYGYTFVFGAFNNDKADNQSENYNRWANNRQFPYVFVFTFESVSACLYVLHLFNIKKRRDISRVLSASWKQITIYPKYLLPDTFSDLPEVIYRNKTSAQSCSK